MITTILTLASLTLTAQASDAETYVIEHRAVDERALVYELRTTHEFLLAEMYGRIDEEEPVPYNAAGTVSTEYYARWRDDCTQLEHLDAPSIKRQFQKLDLKGRATTTLPGQPTRPEQAIFGSDFQGRTLAFTWGPDEQTYGHCYDYYDGPEEPLALIREDANCRSALPRGPVSIGERWTLDAEQTLRLLTPGGNLSMEPQNASVLARSIKLGLGSALSDVLVGETLGGQAEVVLEAVEVDEDGDQIAVLTIEKLSIEVAAEQSELYEEYMSEDEQKEPATVDSVSISTRLSGGGTLRWNITQAQLDSASLRGDEVSDLSISKVFGEEPRTLVRRENASYKGVWKLSLTASTP